MIVTSPQAYELLMDSWKTTTGHVNSAVQKYLAITKVPTDEGKWNIIKDFEINLGSLLMQLPGFLGDTVYPVASYYFSFDVNPYECKENQIYFLGLLLGKHFRFDRHTFSPNFLRGGKETNIPAIKNILFELNEVWMPFVSFTLSGPMIEISANWFNEPQVTTRWFLG